jgi:hypothetical protein
MQPSLDQITPEPTPCLPAWTTTVERRNLSVISPNPVTAISLTPVRTFRNHDIPFLNGATANEFQEKRFADRVTRKKRLNVSWSGNRVAAQ